jgi:hypothetical protein
MWGRLGERPFCMVVVEMESSTMKVHRKALAVLVSSLGLAAFGCSGDDVESKVESAGSGIQTGGKKIESGAKSLSDKITDAGAGTKGEKAANAIGNATEKVGEVSNKAMDKVGEKVKDAAPAIGNAVDKAKVMEEKGVEKIKEGTKALGDEAKKIKEKVTGSKSE